MDFIIDKVWQFSTTLLHFVLIYIGCRLAVKFANGFINKILNRENLPGLASGRGKTLAGLVQSVIRYIIYFSAIIILADEVGIELKPILASAGMVGLAISFGAQSLVRDIITGFFILFEDQYSVSDYITAAKVSGYVEELGLRVTKLRDFKGELHIIPNGLIKQVTNHTRGSNQAVVDLQISLKENLDQILHLFNNFCATYRDPENIIDGPEVLGINAITGEFFSIRLTATTKPMQQWLVERNLRKELLYLIEKYQIQLPNEDNKPQNWKIIKRKLKSLEIDEKNLAT